MVLALFFFFFQAEDGIRDYKVTGVQTCALPISNGIVWPEPMAPWRVAVCVINPKNQNAEVAAAGEALYAELAARGVDVVLDDRGLRPGVMFADIELIGIPHRVVVSERGLAAGTFEYRARRASENEALTKDALFAKLEGA